MKLDLLRKEIDRVDEKIIKLISIRFTVIGKIKTAKKNHHLSIFQKNREEKVLRRIRVLSVKHNLSEEFILKIWRQILRESKKIQK